MTAPKKYMYRIQYIDNTYQIVDWTKQEFANVGTAMANDDQAIALEDGIFRLSDVRAIVYLPPAPTKAKEEIEKEESQLTEWGGYDIEVLQQLRDMGIDVSKTGGDLN